MPRFEKIPCVLLPEKAITLIMSYMKLPRDIFENLSIFPFINLDVTLTFMFFLTASDSILLQLFLSKSFRVLTFQQLCTSINQSS